MALRPQRAGAFDRKVTVQSVTRAGADNTETWADLFDAWAMVTPISASEQFKAGQRLAVETATFRLRYRSDWSPDPHAHRIVYRGKNWDIGPPTLIGRNDAWEMVGEVRGTTGGG
jgi:SPP1 family predicted phage head-tail adaptor